MGRAVTRMLDRMRRSAALLPAAVVLACLAAPCTPAAAAAGKSGADVERQLTALSAEVDRLEGARAVKKLQRAFGYYLDRGLWSEAADLFADDGTIEIGMDGVYVGK
ncbi:MAG: nuclear transport factor 2 family protein, partial [Janthinobacterium lividum]